MALSNEQKKRYRSIGHDLNPVVTIAGNGLSKNVMAELERALNDHELIKIKLVIEDREARAASIERICKQTGASNVQQIGKMALLLKESKNPNIKLSNIR